MQRYPSGLVLGLGASGYAAARLLLGEGTEVTVLDGRDNAGLRERAEELVSRGARVFLGRSDLPRAAGSICIVSPGVPCDSPWILELKASGVPVISELELGWSRAECRVLAVTGSNGKSTLVQLCADALTRAGMKIAVAGNHEDSITGRALPVSRVVAESRSLDWLLLEASSFQLETVREFRPDVGVLLNLLPNHLDRHKDMDAYRRVKLRLFARMTERDIGIIPEDMTDEKGRPVFEPGSVRWISFGTSDAADFRYAPGCIIRGTERMISLSGTVFDNPALGITSAAAAAAVDACVRSCAHLESAVRDFIPLPHRMQYIGTVGGVRFIDDSKSSNMSAISAALGMVGAGVRLIAGGKPKLEDCARVPGLLSGHVIRAYLIGDAADALRTAWRDMVSCVICGTLERAVSEAFQDASPGETILLSPGCSSVDQFANYMERGDRFQLCVDKLNKKNT